MDMTSYLLGKKAGGGTPTILEEKDVTVTSNGESTINPSEGYNGISKVNLTTNVPQPSGKITITQNGTDIDVSSYASADVNVSGGGEDFIYPQYVYVQDSSCVGGGNATTITTSVNAVKDNIVYAIVCARDTISLVESGWTLLKSEKCEYTPTIQTTYVYYKKANADGNVSLTVNQNSSVRLFLSMFATKYSYKQAETFRSAELSHPLENTTTLTDINLVEGDFLMLSTVYSGGGALNDTFTINCASTKYAETSEEQRLTIFRIDEDCKDLTITHDNDNISGTFSYIIMTPQMGTSNDNILTEAVSIYQDIKSKNEIIEECFNETSNNGFGELFQTGAWIDFIKTLPPNHNFKISNPSNYLQYYFYNARFETLDLTNFSNNNDKDYMTLGTNASNCFTYCTALKIIKMGNFRNDQNSGNINLNGMFSACRSLEFLDISGIQLNLITTSSYYTNMFNNVPTNCEIIVKDADSKTWMNTNFSSYTNVKTLAEYEASL